MKASWDFLVAGGGPAGSRAGELLARRGAAVLILDPRAPWEKPCGGGLSAAALEHTPELAELSHEWELVRELLIAAPGGACVRIPLRRPFAVVSRASLSRWGLDRATGAGAEFRRAAVQTVAQTGGGWRVTDSLGQSYRARWLIGADGAASRVRRQVAPRFRPDLAPTRVTYPAGGVPAPAAALLLFPGSQGYLWDFPRRGHHSVGVAVAPSTLGRPHLDWALRRYLTTGPRDGPEASWCGAVVATRPWHSGGLRDLGSPDYALLGDAAGLADPLTGEGIDYALQSAALAARAFDPELGFRRYPGEIGRAFRADVLRWTVLRRALYRPRVVNWLIRQAVRSSPFARVMSALLDAANEHHSLGRIARRLMAPGERRLLATSGRVAFPSAPSPRA